MEIQICWHPEATKPNDEGIAYCPDCKKHIEKIDLALQYLQSERHERDRGKPWKCLCGEDCKYYEIKCSNCERWRM